MMVNKLNLCFIGCVLFCIKGKALSAKHSSIRTKTHCQSGTCNCQTSNHALYYVPILNIHEFCRHPLFILIMRTSWFCRKDLHNVCVQFLINWLCIMLNISSFCKDMRKLFVIKHPSIWTMRKLFVLKHFSIGTKMWYKSGTKSCHSRYLHLIYNTEIVSIQRISTSPGLCLFFLVNLRTIQFSRESAIIDEKYSSSCDLFVYWAMSSYEFLICQRIFSLRKIYIVLLSQNAINLLFVITYYLNT